MHLLLCSSWPFVCTSWLAALHSHYCLLHVLPRPLSLPASVLTQDGGSIATGGWLSCDGTSERGVVAQCSSGAWTYSRWPCTRQHSNCSLYLLQGGVGDHTGQARRVESKAYFHLCYHQGGRADRLVPGLRDATHRGYRNINKGERTPQRHPGGV